MAVGTARRPAPCALGGSPGRRNDRLGWIIVVAPGRPDDERGRDARRGDAQVNVLKLIEARFAPRLVVNKNTRQLARFVGAAAVATWATLLGAALPSASTAPCPDVDVVFARGTGETPGVGG